MKILSAIASICLTATLASALTTADFVGEWSAVSTSEIYSNSNYTFSLQINPDGSYIDSSGELMPDLYPDTQWVEYDEDSNRLIFTYLNIAYAGQYFYQSFFFEVAEYSGNYVDLHYNTYDYDPALPHVQRIQMNRNTPAPLGTPELAIQFSSDGMITLSWDAISGAQSYRIESRNSLAENWSTWLETAALSHQLSPEEGTAAMYRVLALAD